MEPSTQVSMKNRTGLQMSPVQSKEMLETVEGIEGLPNPPEGTGTAMAEMRLEYINEADPLGTVPAPASAKGMVKTGAKMLTGNRPQVFMDKLAERCAFERGGTRLYDGLLTKFRARHDGGTAKPRKGNATEAISQTRLVEIRDQEMQHFQLLADCIEQMGGDPTAQTPSADTVGVQTMGLIQTISDPRTTLTQSLHAALAAELIDVAGWELLAELADGMGQKEMAKRFREALQHENEHLRSIRSWYESSVLQESGSPARAKA